jgi:hypothetical protein
VSRPDHKRGDDEDEDPLAIVFVAALVIAAVLAAMYGYSQT